MYVLCYENAELTLLGRKLWRCSLPPPFCLFCPPEKAPCFPQRSACVALKRGSSSSSPGMVCRLYGTEGLWGWGCRGAQELHWLPKDISSHLYGVKTSRTPSLPLETTVRGDRGWTGSSFLCIRVAKGPGNGILQLAVSEAVGSRAYTLGNIGLQTQKERYYMVSLCGIEKSGLHNKQREQWLPGARRWEMEMLVQRTK